MSLFVIDERRLSFESANAEFLFQHFHAIALLSEDAINRISTKQNCFCLQLSEDKPLNLVPPFQLPFDWNCLSLRLGQVILGVN